MLLLALKVLAHMEIKMKCGFPDQMANALEKAFLGIPLNIREKVTTRFMELEKYDYNALMPIKHKRHRNR